MAGLDTNLDLFLKLKNAGDLKDFNYLYDLIIQTIQSDVSDDDRCRIKEFCRHFVHKLTKRWQQANRCQKTFLNREVNRKWLESLVCWPACSTVDLKAAMGHQEDYLEEPVGIPIQPSEDASTVCSVDAGTSTSGLSRKPFEELGNKQKKRHSRTIIDESSEEELEYFFVTKLKDNGKHTLAKVVQHLSKNPDSLSDVTQFLFKQERPSMLSEDKSLALCTSLSLSKWNYLALRKFVKEEGSVASLPSYQKLLSAKKRCYPLPESVEVTEQGARIRLQSLLDHTTERIFLNLGPVQSSGGTGLKLTWKWGLDGSSSQSNYMQKPSTPEFDDSSVVMTSIVPLRLVDGDNLVVWENPTPCSTYYCRPVKFTFTKETADFIKAETLEMQREISELVPTQCGDAEIVHELHMTMIDGKVVNVVADVSSSAICPICLAKPSEMNNLALLTTKPNREDIYQYGISPLHMMIRCMECLLHVSYNMDFERWSARGEHQALKKAKKDATQREFREQTGLLIDIVKQGFGTTNNGNTARRFFEDYHSSSRITGIDENLLFRFAVILQAISSGKKIKIEGFRSYCKETAELFVHLYPWYYMPVSVHKLLIHGADICSHFSVLPIGILSEEASEARNKDFRNVRERNTRKISRCTTNEDILHGLLISSDPHISQIRPKFSKSSKHVLFPEALALLYENLDNVVFEEEEDMSVETENLPDPLN